MSADTLELLAALDAAGAFVAQVLDGRAALIDALASGAVPSAEHLATLRAQHAADARELQRLAERIGQLRSMHRVH